jgi:hypothetical protein
MSFHSMRELVIWHGERDLFWQLGTALVAHADRAGDAGGSGAKGIENKSAQSKTSPSPHCEAIGDLPGSEQKP